MRSRSCFLQDRIPLLKYFIALYKHVRSERICFYEHVRDRVSVQVKRRYGEIIAGRAGWLKETVLAWAADTV